MPTVMFTTPTPKLVPFPIPIPVPIFIPTTRKSINGISKAIRVSSLAFEVKYYTCLNIKMLQISTTFSKISLSSSGNC